MLTMTALALSVFPVLVAVAIFVGTFQIRRDSARGEARLTILPPQPRSPSKPAT
jgi:hypothetical protein